MYFLAAADDPTGHSKDIFLWRIGDTPVLTMHMLTLLIAAGLFLWLMSIVAKAVQTGPESDGNERFITKGRFAQMIEAMILWLRDEIIQPILGEQNTRKYLPYLLTVFFFIWFNNMLGLIPLLDLQHLIGAIGWGDDHFAIIGGTATGNLMITAGLAVIAGLVIVGHALRDLGPKEFFFHLCGGLLPFPKDQPAVVSYLIMPPIILLVLIIEVLGLLIKPAALAIRLFANMLAGHTLLATLLLFTYMAIKAGLGFFGVAGVAAISGVGAVAIYFLEIFVGTLQAFIFMFLTTVFISLFTHHDEHEHEEHEHHEMAAMDLLDEPTAA